MKNNIFSKEYHAAGSSGSADAAPRMTEKCGRSSPSLSLRGGFANEAISCRLPRPIGLAMTGECGRSMVEMLGVLAVMGVLSVGGVAMYTSAMNKYRANEILNEASKRAAIVAAQAMQGRETLSIAEFPNNEALKFSTEVTHDKTNGQFTLEIVGIAEAVCQQMKNAMGPVIRKFEPATCVDDATVKLTFNDDMSTTAKASDFNTDATGKECTDSGFNWCSGADTPSCQADCCAGFTEGACQTACNSKTGEITYAESGTACDYSTEGANDGMCDGNGTCEQNPCAGATDYLTSCTNSNGKYGYCVSGSCQMDGCFTNDDCVSGQYCKYKGYYGTYCTENTVNANGTGKGGYRGVCTTITSSDYVDKSITGLGGSTTPVTLRKSNGANGQMNWWSAVNWCAAQTKADGSAWQLIDISYNRLQCYNASHTAFGSTTTGSCCSSTASSCDSTVSNQSTAMQSLRSTGFDTSGYLWTQNAKDSCRAFNVDLGYGEVNYGNRYNLDGLFGYFYALCE